MKSDDLEAGGDAQMVDSTLTSLAGLCGEGLAKEQSKIRSEELAGPGHGEG